MVVPAPANVSVLGTLVLATVPDMVRDLPALTLTTVLSFKATAVWRALAEPSVTRIAELAPELSIVSVLPPVTTKEFGFVMVSEPRLSLASRVTVLKVLPMPSVAESPARLGMLGLLLHLLASDQLPSPLKTHAPEVPVAGT